MRWELRTTEVELECGTCPRNHHEFPVVKIQPGKFYMKISGPESEVPMCWDCFAELTND